MTSLQLYNWSTAKKTWTQQSRWVQFTATMVLSHVGTIKSCQLVYSENQSLTFVVINLAFKGNFEGKHWQFLSTHKLNESNSCTCPRVRGTASCVWVRPILMTCANSLDFALSASCSFCSPGSRTSWTSTAAAICIAVGKVSFELCGEVSKETEDVNLEVRKEDLKTN